jgi:hypothetical protein
VLDKPIESSLQATKRLNSNRRVLVFNQLLQLRLLFKTRAVVRLDNALSLVTHESRFKRSIVGHPHLLEFSERLEYFQDV